jgi:hypothetical protein
VHPHGLGHVSLSLGISFAGQRKPSSPRCQLNDRAKLRPPILLTRFPAAMRIPFGRKML